MPWAYHTSTTCGFQVPETGRQGDLKACLWHGWEIRDTTHVEVEHSASKDHVHLCVIRRSNAVRHRRRSRRHEREIRARSPGEEAYWRTSSGRRFFSSTVGIDERSSSGMSSSRRR